VGIYSRVELAPIWALLHGPRFEIGESVSWVSTSGQNVGVRPKAGIPAGRLWLLQSLYVRNEEDVTVDATLLLVDDSGTDHARFAAPDQHQTPVPLGPHKDLTWTGELWVPASWRVGVRLENMAGGARCHWRYTAIEMS
jgi:hypothetical protein